MRPSQIALPIFILLSSPFLSGALAQADPGRDALVSLAQAALAKDAKHSVKKLSRDIVMFHWARSEYIGLQRGEVVKPDDPRVRAYIEREVAQFWDPNTSKGGEIGNGLYTAMDPGTSSSFGGADKAVVELTIHEGTKFLDIRYPVAPLRLKTQQLLAKAGCQEKNLPGVFLDNNLACYAFVRPLLKDLRVPLVAQKWSWTVPMDCGSKPGVAFMLVDAGAAERDGSPRIFNVNSNPDGEDARELRNIEQGILEWGLPGDTMFSGKMKFPDPSDLRYRWGPITQFNSRNEYRDWMKERLFSCGDYKEDAMPPGTPGITPVTRADREAADLMDRYLVDLAELQRISERNEVKLDPTRFRDISLGFEPLGAINDSLLQSWNSGQKLNDSPSLQNLMSQINTKIAQFRDKQSWAWNQGDSTNLIQLGLSAAQQYLEISPPPFAANNDEVARDLMIYVWKNYGQPAVPTQAFLGDLTALNVQDYSSALGKDLWLNPYREGVERIEACIRKYDDDFIRALRDKNCASQ